ncbi:O-antigen ligase family protein [Aquibium carbonis]|uniref:O-antigen ligase family protein n=1 Tax=Aquibium carbonis TaxID=2495581 RepID=A0A429Z037_9HYPH|nr:O-antigen ligase [Aquibium carbonis]RST87077.1 O-antigen ligase family protein [Aquibium carbonis]
MSSIARPRRTEPVQPAATLDRRGAATLFAAVLFGVSIISFRPFSPQAAEATGGDIVNQLGFGAVGIASLFCLLGFVDRRVLVRLVGFWWMVLIGVFLVSVANAADPSSAFRTAIFTLIGVLTMMAVLATPRDADSLSTVFSVTGLAIVALCYAGLVLYPDIARHTGDSLEPEHAGLWRGAFSHKNVAGPVMAALSFTGLYLLRRGWRWSGGLLLVSALYFLAHTGSKTTTGLVPLAILLVMGPSLIGLRRVVPLIFAVALVVSALATIGIVMSPTLWHLSQQVSPGMTYTGRTTLWSFLIEMIAHKPWFGYGYESFWSTPVVQLQELPFDAEWDIRGIVHGHNGYLDIAVLMGLPTLGVAVIAFLVVPMFDFLRVPRKRENILLADFFMMTLMFTAFNAFLESFFFRRVDPVWLFFVLAVFGLRYVARVTIPAVSTTGIADRARHGRERLSTMPH